MLVEIILSNLFTFTHGPSLSGLSTSNVTLRCVGSVTRAFVPWMVCLLVALASMLTLLQCSAVLVVVGGVPERHITLTWLLTCLACLAQVRSWIIFVFYPQALSTYTTCCVSSMYFYRPLLNCVCSFHTGLGCKSKHQIVCPLFSCCLVRTIGNCKLRLFDVCLRNCGDQC